MTTCKIDESPVKVLDPEVKGKAAQGYLWFYSLQADTSSWSFIKAAVAMGRANDCGVFAGPCRPTATSFTMRCARSNRTGSSAIGCTSHARRKFYKALLESCSEALWFIGQMRQLYQLERELKDLRSPRAAPRATQKSPRPLAGHEEAGRSPPGRSAGAAPEHLGQSRPLFAQRVYSLGRLSARWPV